MVDSLALQALQQDLPETLIDEAKLKDEFQETFFTRILGGASQ